MKSVCMCVYVFVCTCVYVFVCTCVCVCLQLRIFCFLVKNSSCYCHQLWIPQLHVESFKNFGYTGNPVCNFPQTIYTHMQHMFISITLLVPAIQLYSVLLYCVLTEYTFLWK